MKWKKLGQLFCPDNHFPWMISHAANPFVEILGENTWQVYFTCRNTQNQSHIGFVWLDSTNDFSIRKISDSPVLSPGEPGLFDDSGTAMGYLLTVEGKKYLYYLGWNLKVTVPWLNTIGLAIRDENAGRFIKYSQAPIMDRSHEDPFTISYPSILYENGVYRMWYGSNLKWGNDESTMDHVIKYAESRDAIHWKRSGKVVVDLEHPNEYALSKPYVIKEKDHYSMWYSYRGNENIATYRIGYASSKDGLSWKRDDKNAGIDVSASGWDSEMVCYPFVFSHGGKRYMLYNGNGYGKTGFGLAVLEN